MRIAVFASGNGSNFEAIVKAVLNGRLSAQITSVIYNKPQAYVKTRAEKYGIPAHYFDVKAYVSKVEYEQAILKQLQQDNVELLVLAGYMVFIGEVLLQAYPNRIVNIHPSLLPQFPGKNGIADAFAAHVNQTGVTVHLVDEGIDTGPILKQWIIAVNESDTLERLEEKIHRAEHVLYPLALSEYIEKIKQEGKA